MFQFPLGNHDMHVQACHEASHATIAAMVGVPFGCVSIDHLGNDNRGHFAGAGMLSPASVPRGDPRAFGYAQVGVAGVLGECLFQSFEAPTPSTVSQLLESNDGDRAWLRSFDDVALSALTTATWQTLFDAREKVFRLAEGLLWKGRVSAGSALGILEIGAGSQVLPPCEYCAARLREQR